MWPLRVKQMMFRKDAALMYIAQIKRLGIPIEYGVNIVKYTEAIGTATVEADDGRQWTGDVVVAVDGIGTKSHAVTLGHTVRAVSTGYCADRVAYSTKELKNAPALKKFLEGMERPSLTLYTAPKTHVIFFLTHDRVCLIMTHPDDGSAVESWAATVTPEQVGANLPDLEGWDPVLREAIASIPEGNIVRWKLCWRNPQPKWTSAGGRILQLRDAAHSFIPTSANGAGMALEDAISFAECLRLAGDKASVPVATRVHEKLRFQRTSLIQRTGFANRCELHRDVDKMVSDGKRPLHFGKWIWAHNAEKYATDNFDAARAHVETGAPFENTNLPPGHKFEDWTMEDELAKEEAGVYQEDLKTNGDWGLV